MATFTRKISHEILYHTDVNYVYDRIEAAEADIATKANSSHTHPVTDMTATGTRSTSTYLRGDNTWATPPNTTYSVMTQSEAETGTATTARAMSAERLKATVQYHAPVKVSDLAPAADARISAQKGVANGLATLGPDSKIPVSQLPSLALSETYVVNSQASQLALTAQQGDIAVRTDIGQTFVHNGGTAGTIADWTQLATPTDAVASVNGMTGAVTLNKSHVGLGNVDNTSDTSKPISTATQTALDGKANSNHTHGVADISATGTRSSSVYLRGDGTWNTPINTTYSLISQAEAENSASTTARLVSGQRLYQAVQVHAPVKASDLSLKADQSALLSHTDSTSNPHGVTKAQVGLSNVDNTADLLKPVSQAMQTALDGKASTSHVHVVADITASGTRDSTTYLRGDGTWGNPGGYMYPAISTTEILDSASTAERSITGQRFAYGVANTPPMAHTHGVADITATGTRSSSNYLRGDGAWVTPPNTTYSTISTAEATNSASTIARLVSGQRLAEAVAFYSPPPPSNYDDRYYTETETDTLLSAKADASTLTTHTGDIGNPHQVTAAQVGAAPIVHTHDDRYYTESETTTLLSGKANTSHTHDDRYYTESETNTLLAGKANTSHTHGLEVPTAGYQKLGSQQVNIADGATYQHGSWNWPADTGAMAFQIVVAMSVYGDLGYSGSFYIRCFLDGVMYESNLFQADQGVDAGAVFTFGGMTSSTDTTRTFTLQTRCATGIYTARNTSVSYMFSPRTTTTV